MRRGPSLLRLLDYTRRCLRLGPYLDRPGDGRRFPQIPATTLLSALLLSKVLRQYAYLATEQLVHVAARALGVSRPFGDDALAYFTERLDVGRLREALLGVLRCARRNKAFEHVSRLGLALDGTGLGRSKQPRCELCHPQFNASHDVMGHGHKMVGASVVAGPLTLPIDVEFYPQGEGEVTAGKRLLERVVRSAGVRFDYLVVDGLYPGAPFLALADQVGLPVVARLTDMLPELFHAAQLRYRDLPPATVYEEGHDRIEIWDAEDFRPWEGLTWPRVRVLRYRQHKRDGTVVEAYWLTNLPHRKVGSRALYRIAKSRWQIENRFFNEGKNLYGLEHIPHHHAHALLVDTLLTCLALCLERLYRLRYLHRGRHRPYRPAELCRLFWLALGAPPPLDTS